MTASSKRWKSWLLVAVCLPLAAWMLLHAQRSFQADWASMAARQNVERWVSAAKGAPDASEWEAAQQGLQEALATTPRDPLLLERLGDLHSVAARRDWADASLRDPQLKQAAEYYEAALALRPGTAATWTALAATRQAMGSKTSDVQAAWEKGRSLGPYEAHVQPVLLQVVLADWDRATPAMQAWAKLLFDRSDRATRAQINALARLYGLQFAADEAESGPTTR